MSRYIDANKLLEQMKKESIFMFNNYLNGFVRAMKTLENQPTADVKEVIHAEWERKGQTCTFYCSECGKEIKNTRLVDNSHKAEVINIWDEYIYCPNCGAKMDKEE